MHLNAKERTAPPSFLTAWCTANRVPWLAGTAIGWWLWPLLLMIGVMTPRAPDKASDVAPTLKIELVAPAGLPASEPMRQAPASAAGATVATVANASPAASGAAGASSSPSGSQGVEEPAPCASFSSDRRATWQGCIAPAKAVASVVSTWAAHPLVLSLSSAFTLAMFLRMLMWRHLYRAGSAHVVEAPDEIPLLPSQRQFVETMVDRLLNFPLWREGPLWALEGRWGEGKSFLAEAIRLKLERAGRPVVYVHIWREQTAANLHLAIVEAILRHPAVLHAAFAGYPVSRMIARSAGHWIQNLLPEGLQFSQGGITGKLDARAALPLFAQRDLEQVVAYLRARHIALTLILDEIDRATPAIAQAALVLSRRALNLPGLAVVMPFVSAQLEQKVTNPVLLQTPDLMHTFLAHLQDAYPIPLVAAQPAPLPEDTTAAPTKGGDPWQDANMRRALDYEKRLLIHYSGLGEAVSRHLAQQTLEKYLSLRAPVPALTAADLPEVLKFKSIMPLLGPYAHRDAALENELTQAIQKAHERTIQRLGIGQGSGLAAPAVRHLEGRLVLCLSIAGAPDRLTPHADPAAAVRRIAALAALAWRSAQVLQARLDANPAARTLQS